MTVNVDLSGLEKILLTMGIAAVIITLYLLQQLSKKSKKVDVLLNYMLATGFFIGIVFGIFLRPIRYAFVWIIVCLLFFLLSVWNGNRIRRKNSNPLHPEKITH